ncbi:MAG TPA: ABC transporter permease [Tepidisphaeraceae bacterium]|nr:ABC transporter permease [Tepidisphaeraceae bacterium]
MSQLELTKAIEPVTQAPAEQPELVIKPRRGWIAVDWRELWTHRELLYFLVWRDVKVRYKQAVLGIAWAVLAPVLSVMVFTLIFGHRGLGVNTELPGPPEHAPLSTSLFIFAGLIPWMFLSQAIGTGGLALVNQQNLLSKIYMPRLFIPASTIGSGLVDMCISFGVFFTWMLCTGYRPSPGILLLPLLILLTVLLSLGLAFVLSAMTVTYRDLRFLIPFITQIGMWMSAVVYPYKAVFSGKVVWLQLLNPFYGIVDAFRSALFPGWGWQPWHLLASILWAAGLLAFGIFYFRKTERRFADIA